MVTGLAVIVLVFTPPGVQVKLATPPAVNVAGVPAQTVVEPATVTEGPATTLIETVDVQTPLASVADTVYVPDIPTVALGIVAFWVLAMTPPGPVHV